MLRRRKSLFTFEWLEKLILSDLYLQSLALLILLSFSFTAYWHFAALSHVLYAVNLYTLLVYYETRFRYKIRFDGIKELFVPILTVLLFFIGYAQYSNIWIYLAFPSALLFGLIFVLFSKAISFVVLMIAVILEMIAIQRGAQYWGLHATFHLLVPLIVVFYINPLRWQRLFNALALEQSELNRINHFQKNHQSVYSDDLSPDSYQYQASSPETEPVISRPIPQQRLNDPSSYDQLKLLDTSFLEGNQIPSLNTISVAQSYELQNRMIEQLLKDAFDQELQFLADVYGLDHLAILWKRNAQELEMKASIGVVQKHQVFNINAFLKQALEQPFELVQQVKGAKYLYYLPAHIEVGAIYIQPITGLGEDYEASGLLCVDRKSSRAWSMEEKMVFSAVVQRIQFYLQIALRMKGNVKEQDFTQKLCMGLKRLNHALDSKQVAQATIQALKLYDDIDMVAFCIKERNVPGYRITQYWMEEKKLSDRDLSLLDLENIQNAFCPLTEGLVADVMKSAQVLEQKRNLQSMLFNPKILVPSFEALLLIPIKKSISQNQQAYLTDIHEVYAVMAIGSHKSNAFHALSDQRAAIELISEQIEIKINLARAYETIKEMANIDGLTGLKNHRSFQDEFDHLLMKAKRNLLPISLLLLDLDHFKKINDSYGHPFGDLVLKSFAQRLTSNMREVDVVARYGGEEFVVILPDTDINGALQYAQRVLEDIQSLYFEHQGESIHISVSIGISCSSSYGLNKAELIQRADQALYEAKNGGRACIRVSQSMIDLKDMEITRPARPGNAEIISSESIAFEPQDDLIDQEPLDQEPFVYPSHLPPVQLEDEAFALEVLMNSQPIPQATPLTQAPSFLLPQPRIPKNNTLIPILPSFVKRGQVSYPIDNQTRDHQTNHLSKDQQTHKLQDEAKAAQNEPTDPLSISLPLEPSQISIAVEAMPQDAESIDQEQASIINTPPQIISSLSISVDMPLKNKVIDFTNHESKSMLNESVPPDSLTAFAIPQFVPTIEEVQAGVEDDKILMTDQINDQIFVSIETDQTQYLEPTPVLPLPQLDQEKDPSLVDISQHPFKHNAKFQKTDHLPYRKYAPKLPTTPELSSPPPAFNVEALPQNNSTNYQIIPQQPVLLPSIEIHQIEPEFNINAPINRLKEMPVNDQKEILPQDVLSIPISNDFPKPNFKNPNLKIPTRAPLPQAPHHNRIQAPHHNRTQAPLPQAPLPQAPHHNRTRAPLPQVPLQQRNQLQHPSQQVHPQASLPQKANIIPEVVAMLPNAKHADKQYSDPPIFASNGLSSEYNPVVPKNEKGYES